MNKAVIYGLAAAVGVGGGVALFSMMSSRPDSTRGPTPASEEVAGPVSQPESFEGRMNRGAERKPEPPDRELRPHEEALKKQLEEGFGLHTRHAGPAWNAVGYNLGEAGLDVDAAKAREMSKALSGERRNPDVDAVAFVARERALIEELRAGAAGGVVESDLARIEGLIEDFESAPGDEE